MLLYTRLPILSVSKIDKNESENEYELHWMVFLWCKLYFKMKYFVIVSSKATIYCLNHSFQAIKHVKIILAIHGN